MSDIRLSICIPTYNFGPFIGQTLESLTRELEPGVEIVVVDGASTDNTTEVVLGFQKQFPAISYHRLGKKGGIDRDMAASVGLAKGEYVWLFSADDVAAPGALARVLAQLSSRRDVYLCGFTLSTLEMEALGEHPILDCAEDRDFDLADRAQRLDYFERARTTPAFFSFCGSLVFKKARWDAHGLDEAWVGTCWAHVARFFKMLPEGLKVRFLAGSFLYKRLGNDSFMDKGIAGRVAIGVEGYHRLAREFFGQDSREAFHIRRAIRNEYPAMALLARKLECLEQGGTDQAAAMDRLASQVFCDPGLSTWVQRSIYRGMPFPLVRAAKSVHGLKKRLTAQKVTIDRTRKEMPCT